MAVFAGRNQSSLIPNPAKRQWSPNLSSSSSYWRLAIKWLIIVALALWYVASAVVTGWTVVNDLVGQWNKNMDGSWLFTKNWTNPNIPSPAKAVICLQLWLVEQLSMVWLANAVSMDGSWLYTENWTYPDAVVQCVSKDRVGFSVCCF